MSKKPSLFSEVSDLSVPSQRGGASKRTTVDPREISQLVGEVRPDDGVNPRDEARRRRQALGDARPGFSHGEHKQEQLLAQVHEAVEAALRGAADAVLSALEVREVVRQGGALVVVVGPSNPAEPLDLPVAAAALDAGRAMLTREVAAEITRKEVPHLRFLVLPAGAARVED